MAKADDTTNRITVYRLKTHQILADAYVSGCEKVADGVEINTDYEYTLWFGNYNDYTPNWFPPFKEIADKTPSVKQSGFVLLIGTADSTYACTGGLGYHKLLESFKIEPRFGIILAKKIMSITNIKGLVQKDANGIVNNLDRVFRGTYNPQGDIDNLHRVLTNIRASFPKGKRQHSEIGASIRAGDSLAANGTKDFSAIFAFIQKVDELWANEQQGLAIPELEHVNPKHEKDLLAELMRVLARDILKFKNPNEENHPNLFLDNITMGYLPDRVVEYILVHQRQQHRFSSYSEVFRAIADILAQAHDDSKPLYAELEAIKLKFKYDDDYVNKPKPALQYICGDVVFNDEAYFINNGLWFKANENFIDKVNAELDQVEYLQPDKLSLQEWNITEYENAYNTKHALYDLIVLDRHLVSVEQERGGIEFCDLLRHQNDSAIDLIHVKKATGAALRALFAQGYVSAQLYSESDEFQRNVHEGQLSNSKNLTQQGKAGLASLAEKPRRKFRVVYAIYDDTPSHFLKNGITDKVTESFSGTLTLFAKIDLLGRVQAIQALGYNVALTRIKPYPTQE